MIAANIMTAAVHTLTPGTTLLDAIRLAAKTPAQIPVVGVDNKILGVIQWRTLLKAVLPEQSPDAHLLSFVKRIEGLSSLLIDKFIDKEYSSVLPHARLAEIAAIFMDGNASDCILVVDDHERLLGMISPSDVFKRLWEYSEK